MKMTTKIAGLVNLNREQLVSSNGGGIGTALAIIGAGIYIYNNWDDFTEGFKEGWNENREE